MSGEARADLPAVAGTRAPQDRSRAVTVVWEVEAQRAVAVPRPRTHRARALRVLLVLGLILAGWWGSGYVFAYTDDAYVTSDIVSIAPEVSGPVEAVLVADNQRVTRGTLLFTIDPTPFILEVRQAQSQEEQARAQLSVDQAMLATLGAQQDAAETAARLAHVNLGRDATLADSGFVSRRTLDTTRTAQEQADAQVRAAQAAVQRAASTLHLHEVAVATAHATRMLAEWRLGRTRIVAPVDGYVTHLTLQPGDMVSPAAPALAIVDGHAWRVVANYKEYALRHLRPGHDAWVWLDSRPWHLYRARIEGPARGISRVRGDEGLVPYVSPTVDWIRLQRRIPVRMVLIDADAQDLFMGADARILVIY